MDSSQWPKLGYAKCVNGLSIPIPGDPAHTFKCKNVSDLPEVEIPDTNDIQMDLHSFISHADLGAPTGEGSSSWGWTDPASGREFIGRLHAFNKQPNSTDTG